MKCVRSLLLLIPALALATPALAQRDVRLADSQEPGSVIVFPKFIKGTTPLPEGGSAPATEIEVGIVCPTGFTCPEHMPVKIRFHWVCPSTEANPAGSFICQEADFDVTATVWEKIVLVPNGLGTTDGVGTRFVPAPPCPRGFLVGWVENTSDVPIKFDGLIGDAVLRESGSAFASYTAIPIQASPALATGQTVSLGANGGLIFDGADGHYQAVTGKVFGDVRYSNVTGPTTFATSFVTLLTLDVLSNRPNNPIAVDFNFYAGFNSALGVENVISTSTEFICWTEQRIDVIDGNLTTTVMGRKGTFESTAATKFLFGTTLDGVGPVTLLGLTETVEGPTPGSAMREYINSLYNNSVVVTTTLVP